MRHEFICIVIAGFVFVEGTALGAEAFRIVVSERAKVVKEHVATLRVGKGELVFSSATKPDYRFVSQQVDVIPSGIAPGSYQAFVNDRPLFFPGTVVTIKQRAPNYLVEAPNGLSIELVPIEVSEPPKVTSWQSPFGSKASPKYSTIAQRVVSPFGAGRSSFRIKHLHTGVDLRGESSEAVYPIGEGVVEFVSYWDFEGTVVVRQNQASGEPLMSKYIHVRDPRVRAGDSVTKDKALARLFTKAEFKKSGFKYNHLHLELRKDYSDHGHASTNSKNQEDLSKCCVNPVTLLPQK